MSERRIDKYGRGSAAVNGAGFVDLLPGDTFEQLEKILRQRIADRYENVRLGLCASIASNRNANELAKHLAKGECEEVHKFAAKNIGALFVRGAVGVRHLDKKAVAGQRWVTVYLRVFSAFVFAERKYVATITLKELDGGAENIYAVEALEINQDADSEVHLAEQYPEGLNSAPIQNLASQLGERIAYYVGDVNRTRPAFVNDATSFSIPTAVEKLLQMLGSPQSA